MIINVHDNGMKPPYGDKCIIAIGSDSQKILHTAIRGKDGWLVEAGIVPFEDVTWWINMEDAE